MQRVISEILRRSTETSEKHPSKKRTLDDSEVLHPTDGKFAEETFTRETRGARPGHSTWSAKRKRTDDYDTRRFYEAAM
jgi:hypothetical protein